MLFCISLCQRYTTRKTKCLWLFYGCYTELAQEFFYKQKYPYKKNIQHFFNFIWVWSYGDLLSKKWICLTIQNICESYFPIRFIFRKQPLFVVLQWLFNRNLENHPWYALTASSTFKIMLPIYLNRHSLCLLGTCT